MEPGPDRYIACPRCGAVARHETILSGNTFGAVLWSDGLENAPMLPQQPPIVRCAKCEGHYWLRDAKEIGEFYGFEGEQAFPPECDGAPWIQEPSAGEYMHLVCSGFARNPDEERTLRILAWQRHNDPYRCSPDPLFPSPDPPQPTLFEKTEQRLNLEALLPLLDSDDEGGVLYRAGVLRALGRFEEAVRIVNETQWNELAEMAFQMGIWCKRRDSSVRAFETSPW